MKNILNESTRDSIQIPNWRSQIQTKLSGNDKLVFGWLIYVFLLPFLSKFDLGSISSYLNKFEEISIILLFPTIKRGWVFISNKPLGRFAALAFVLYLGLGALSWLFSPIAIKAFVLQLLLELKIFVIILVMIGITNTSLFYEKIQKAFKMLLLISIPLVLWQFLSIDTYNIVFSMGAHRAKFSGLTMDLQRAAGVFWHPGQLGVFSGVMTGLFFFQWKEKRTRKNLFWLMISFSLLVAAMSRNEFFATFFALICVTYVFKRESYLGKKYLFFFILICVMFFVVLPLLKPYLNYSVTKLGLANVEASGAARVVFYRFGFDLANDFFPLGVGLGGYGGHAANKFNSVYYHYLGFGKYWWFQQGLYMTDTFWPHVLAEAGWIGLFFYLLFVFNLFKFNFVERKPKAILLNDIHNNLDKETRHRIKKQINYRMMSLYAYLFLLTNSITTPNFTTPFSIVLGTMFMGALKQNDN